MYAEMICNCASSFSIDFETEVDGAVWHLIWRFVNAHVACGFATPEKPDSEDNETFKEKSLKAGVTLLEEDDEEEEEDE